MIEAYPLTWPMGFKRTASQNRIRSQFKQSMEKAQTFMRAEVNRIDGIQLVVSSNIPVRRDGYFYTDWMNRKIDDPGVAIYFRIGKEDISMCCDQYNTIWENVYALGKSIEALRAIERYGCSEFMKRVFTGFKALPETISLNCWDVLDMKPSKDKELIKMQYKVRAFSAHPDHGGTAEKFHQLQNAFEQAMIYANS